METAEKLLHDPTLTLEAISGRVGLSSASALSRAIKGHFGFSPRALRQRTGLLNRLTPSDGE
jgi:AraC-like DNA-binding protein